MEKTKIKPEEDNTGLHSTLVGKEEIVEVEIKITKRDPETNEVTSAETYHCEPNTGYSQIVTKMNHYSGRKQRIIQIEGFLKDD